MNESLENDGDPKIRRLLAESDVEESQELLEGLRLLRSFRASPAPEPSGELATLLKTANPPRQRAQRHRGFVLSFALAGAMAVGTTGVAASNALRLTSESVTGDATEPAQPAEEDSGDAVPQPAESPGVQTPSPDAAPEFALSPDAAPEFALSPEALPAGGTGPVGPAEAESPAVPAPERQAAPETVGPKPASGRGSRHDREDAGFGPGHSHGADREQRNHHGDSARGGTPDLAPAGQHP